jgi:pilus assembly protein Flp/PilA
MLKPCIAVSESLKSLRHNTRGVVSFEYVIVAACIVAAVIAAFGATGGNISTALSGVITKIITAIGTVG